MNLSDQDSPSGSTSNERSILTERDAGVLRDIYIAAERGAPMTSVDAVTAVAGEGLAGDRYAAGAGTFSARAALVPGARALSLIDDADIARCNERLGQTLDTHVLRRNLVVEGIDLLALRGQRLAIGPVVIRLAGRCAPCGLLSRYVGADMRRGLYRGGGMRGVIETGGSIRVGQAVICLG